MELFPKALQPLREVARALFVDEVRLVSEAGRLRLRVGRTPPPADAPAAGRPAAPDEAELLAEMRAQLAEVLDQLPELRAQNRQLALFEAALAHAGLGVLQRLPLPVLSGALDELEGLVTNWSPQALACLRSKMSVERRRRTAIECVDTKV